MAALSDLSDIINRVTGGSSGAPENLFFYKDARVTGGAAAGTVIGRMTSLWQFAGQPTHGPVPGVAAALTNTSDGGLKQVNPVSGKQKWLLGVNASAMTMGTLFLYDRLLHSGGLSATVITAQTVGGTLTRNTGGAGNQIWLEIYNQIGSTGTTVRASYTNQNGVAGQLTEATTFGGTGFREGQRLIQLPLAVGDTGVQSVQSVTVLATTGTAGNFGVNIMRPITSAQLSVVGCGSVRDLIAGLPGIIEIDSNACLTFGWLAASTIAPQVFGSLHMIEK
jgi:hypothetical protein